MNDLFNYLHLGFGYADFGLAVNCLFLGTFFAISGYHKLFNKQRHLFLVGEFHTLHIPFIRFNQWFVPGVEFFGGLSLLSGVLSPFAAMGLLVICLVATCTAGVKRIPNFHPIDKADWLDDLFYLPEVSYIVGLIVVITCGAGPITLFNLIYD
jgi:uncharacterized membrane protein YphA (DoxX/SURF4 family)